MNEHWTERDWQTLAININGQNCTPFLGAGAAFPTLRLGKEIAQQWAKEYLYPFDDSSNLARVAQYVAVQHGTAFVPKSMIVKEIAGKKPSEPSDDDPHRILAELGLPLYMTTNYDNFMHEALLRASRPAVRAHCQWHTGLGIKRLKRQQLDPTRETPVVYHLHGIAEDPRSIVITEEDYLNFLILTSADKNLIPPQIAEAFSNKSLLFLGYSLQDINFQVLFRRFADMISSSETKHFAVQIDPATDPVHGEAQRIYLQKQLHGKQVKVFWGNCAEFCLKLRDHCRPN
jgi:hypothetical protein